MYTLSNCQVSLTIQKLAPSDDPLPPCVQHRWTPDRWWWRAPSTCQMCWSGIQPLQISLPGQVWRTQHCRRWRTGWSWCTSRCRWWIGCGAWGLVEYFMFYFGIMPFWSDFWNLHVCSKHFQILKNGLKSKSWKFCEDLVIRRGDVRVKCLANM